jgi:hypothetical protein
MQVYGNTIVLYTTYSYELESGGKRSIKSARELKSSFAAATTWSTSAGTWNELGVRRPGGAFHS